MKLGQHVKDQEPMPFEEWAKDNRDWDCKATRKAYEAGQASIQNSLNPAPAEQKPDSMTRDDALRMIGVYETYGRGDGDELFGVRGRFPDAGDLAKAMRWLGWCQGVLFERGTFTLEELKDHSRSRIVPKFSPSNTVESDVPPGFVEMFGGHVRAGDKYKNSGMKSPRPVGSGLTGASIEDLDDYRIFRPQPPVTAESAESAVCSKDEALGCLEWLARYAGSKEVATISLSGWVQKLVAFIESTPSAPKSVEPPEGYEIVGEWTPANFPDSWFYFNMACDGWFPIPDAMPVIYAEWFKVAGGLMARPIPKTEAVQEPIVIEHRFVSPERDALGNIVAHKCGVFKPCDRVKVTVEKVTP